MNKKALLIAPTLVISGVLTGCASNAGVSQMVYPAQSARQINNHD